MNVGFLVLNSICFHNYAVFLVKVPENANNSFFRVYLVEYQCIADLQISKVQQVQQKIWRGSIIR